MKSIAVLITCFNRKDKTIDCLNSIFKLKGVEGVLLDVYIVDGGSSDGTPVVVSQMFPQVKLDISEGLYWAGGMRKAWRNAIATKDYDYYWLINDDTNIYSDCLTRLLDADRYCLSQYGRHGIYTGSTKSPTTGKLTYGAKNLLNKKRIKNKMVMPSMNAYLECDLCNGNILFIPKDVYESVGILNSYYTHGMADWDYSLRVKQKGFPVLVVPDFLGECERDHGKGYLPQSASLKKRVEYMNSPKGLSYKEFMHFMKEFFPNDYYPQKLRFWMKTLFPILYDVFKQE